MTTQLYYKTISPRDLGIYASNNWKNSYNLTKNFILNTLKGRRGNIKDIIEYVNNSGSENFEVSAKWYGGQWNRWKIDIQAC